MAREKIKKELGKFVGKWKNPKEEVFDFEQKPIKFESPPEEIEASAFERYITIGSKKEKAQ